MEPRDVVLDCSAFTRAQISHILGGLSGSDVPVPRERLYQQTHILGSDPGRDRESVRVDN